MKPAALTIDVHGQAWRGAEPLDLRFSPGRLRERVARALKGNRYDSAADLARRCGMTPQRLSDLCAGRPPNTDPGVRRIARLIAALGCRFEDLLE